MAREYINLHQHAVEEKIKESPGKIISHDIQADSSYQERSVQFRKKLAKEISPTMPPETIINQVVEAALHTEFTPGITRYPVYENMKATIVGALLRDPELKERILTIADKYRKPEHTH